MKTLKQVMEEKLDSKNVQLASVTKEKGFRIYTDAEMAAVVIHFNKWIAEVFDFGKLFGKITDHHDYKSADPLTNLTSIQKTTLRYYLSTYHQFQYDMAMT